MKVELVDIHKHYGAVTANEGISLCVAPGTIHGILGENGAGKSTLMKVLAGLVRPDRGAVVLDGQPRSLSSPGTAVARGIGMCYQEPLDFAPLTVLQNFSIGVGALRDTARACRLFNKVCRDLGFVLEPDLPVERLTVGQRQQLEMARLLAAGVSVLILDEPTTGLHFEDVKVLLSVLNKLVARGNTVLIIEHNMEVIKVADHIVDLGPEGGLRGGKVIAEGTPEEVVSQNTGYTAMHLRPLIFT